MDIEPHQSHNQSCVRKQDRITQQHRETAYVVLSSPPMRPRFAVCISGDLRAFAGLAWTLDVRLLQSTRAAVHVFAHVWTSGSPLDQAGEAMLTSMPELKRAVVENEVASGNLTADAYGGDARLNLPHHSNQGFYAFRSQWRKVHLSFRLAFEHAAAERGIMARDMPFRELADATGDYYGAYVRTRADMYYVVPLDLAAEHATIMKGLERRGWGSQYFATQACITVEAVPDSWMIATPRAAAAYAALPTHLETRVMEAFMYERMTDLAAFEWPDVATCPSLRTARKRLTNTPHGAGPVLFIRPPSSLLVRRCSAFLAQVDSPRLDAPFGCTHLNSPRLDGVECIRSRLNAPFGRSTPPVWMALNASAQAASLPAVACASTHCLHSASAATERWWGFLRVPPWNTGWRVPRHAWAGDARA